MPSNLVTTILAEPVKEPAARLRPTGHFVAMYEGSRFVRFKWIATE